MGCSVGMEHPPMLGDCVRCAVVPGVGGSTPAMPRVDSGSGTGMQNDGGSFGFGEGGTFGDGGMTERASSKARAARHAPGNRTRSRNVVRFAPTPMARAAAKKMLAAAK